MVQTEQTGSSDVTATRRDILDALPDRVDPLRDRTVLYGDAARTTRIEIRRTGQQNSTREEVRVWQDDGFIAIPERTPDYPLVLEQA